MAKTLSELPQSGEVLCAFPSDLAFLLEQRLLLPGECAAEYDGLLASIVAAVKPADAIEAIWTKDVVDKIWEVNRLQRFKARLLEAGREQALETILRDALPMDPGDIGAGYLDTPRVAAGWATGKTQDVKQVGKFLQRRGLDAETITATSLVRNLSEIERIERMIGSAEARRDAVLRDLERRRESIARRLRRVAEDVQEFGSPSAGSWS